MASEVLMREYIRQSSISSLLVDKNAEDNCLINKSDVLFDYKCDHGNNHTDYSNTHYDTTITF